MYEVFISEVVYCLLYYFKTILIPFFPCQISGISLTRGKEFIKYWPKVFDLEEEKSTDEWWWSNFSVNAFNAAFKNIADSSLKVWDESMIEIRFRTTAKRKLPHLSYIFRKPEPMGEALNTVSSYVTENLIFI